MNHKAWRYLSGHTTWYVESFNWSPNRKGDPYSYTSDINKALLMTEAQCKKFCKYMRECASVGFWN